MDDNAEDRDQKRRTPPPRRVRADPPDPSPRERDIEIETEEHGEKALRESLEHQSEGLRLAGDDDEEY